MLTKSLKSALLSGVIAAGACQAAALPEAVWVGVLTLGPNDDIYELVKVEHGAQPPEPRLVGFSFRYDDQGVWGTQLSDDGYLFTGRAFVFSSPEICSVYLHVNGWGFCPSLLGYNLIPQQQFASALILPASALVPEPDLSWLILGGLGVLGLLAATRQRGGQKMSLT